jgi:hypothetical protein
LSHEIFLMFFQQFNCRKNHRFYGTAQQHAPAENPKDP